MNSITKFSRDMLNGKLLKINKKTKQTSFEYHWHDYYEIILYLNCQGQCIINDHAYPIDKNCLFLVTPKDFHEIRTIDKDDAISINLSFSEQIVESSLLSTLTPVYIDGISEQLINDFLRLLRCFNSSDKHKDIYSKNLFNCILIDIYKEGKIIDENVLFLNPLIQKAITYVITNPEKKFNVQTLSKFLGVNADYFSHLFKNETGITFTKYLNQIRIEHAKRLLENTDLSVLEISYESGFNTPTHFYKTFKAQTNFSPKEYKKNKR